MPALQTQKEKLKSQLTKQRQECLELEMNVESMLIEVKEPPPIGNSKLICGHCHHRGHRNSGCQPCKMKKCTEYTYCGLRDKHPEYFSKLNSLKVELKKKKSALQEIEAQIKSMDDFTTGSEYSFVKNITPRMIAADPSYKSNKAKLMRDVRLLRTFQDGKIPPVTANDEEQLRIIISKCKRNVGISPETNVDAFPSNNAACSGVSNVSPIKNEDKRSEKKHKHKKRSQRKAKKVKKRRRRERYSSSSSSDDMRPYRNKANAGTFPFLNHAPGASYNFPIPFANYNPYLRSEPPFNPFSGPYASSCNVANRGNGSIVTSVDNQQQQIYNTNLFEDPSPLGSLNLRFTTTLTPPKSSENKRHYQEQGISNNFDALPLLADAAIAKHNADK